VIRSFHKLAGGADGRANGGEGGRALRGLGFALVAGAASGALGPGDFPRPVGTAVIVVVGCLLLGVAVVLWRGAISPAALAAANGLTAAAALVWLATASGFSPAGTSVLGVTVVALGCLAAAQLAASRGRVLSRSVGPGRP
jgi:hypothetical protein